MTKRDFPWFGLKMTFGLGYIYPILHSSLGLYEGNRLDNLAFIWYWSEQTVEQTVHLSVIWDVMWCHSNTFAFQQKESIFFGESCVWIWWERFIEICWSFNTHWPSAKSVWNFIRLGLFASWAENFRLKFNQYYNNCMVHDRGRFVLHGKYHSCRFLAWWRHQMKTFPHYWPLVPDEFPAKGQWRGALMFSLILRLNKRLSKQSWDGDLRRHRAHYNAIVMATQYARASAVMASV